MKPKKKYFKWLPPRNAASFFASSSDYDFKKAHPIGYRLTIGLGIVVLIAPMLIVPILAGSGQENGWPFLGCIGGFVFGIGLFNFVAIILDQYLGHLVSILSFIIGGAMLLLSLLKCAEF